MRGTNSKLIAVIGATGQQGGAVVGALQGSSQFKVRALTRNPDKHRELADDVVKADLNLPETLRAAFEGAHGVFLVTNFWEERYRRAQGGNSGDTRCQGCRCPTFCLQQLAPTAKKDARLASRK